MSQPVLTTALPLGQPFPADEVLVCPRFDEKVEKGDGCWLWTGNKLPTGYGRFSFDGHYYQAHRVAYQFVYGLIARKLFVCHACDNPSCVRPDHLFAGTHEDNMADMWRKGRGSKNGIPQPGELNPQAELSERDVMLIRALAARGIPQILLADVWEVSFQHVSDIVRGERWGHVA